MAVGITVDRSAREDLKQRQESVVAATIGAVYGTPYTIEVARHAIYCKLFAVGRTLHEVEADLDKLGEWYKFGTEYQLRGLYVGQVRFNIVPDLDASRIKLIYVTETSGQSDPQRVRCSVSTYELY
jgi:hypothetical protein